MSDFTPITTQEEFDKAIKGRLAQKDREAEERFKDYLSPDKVSSLKEDYESQIKELKEAAKKSADKLSENSKTVDELTKRAEAAECSLLKNKIAYENKLPLELAGRLVGNNEDELKKDAETLASLLKPSSAPPLRSSDPNNTKGNVLADTEMLGLLGQLKGNM